MAHFFSQIATHEVRLMDEAVRRWVKTGQQQRYSLSSAIRAQARLIRQHLDLVFFPDWAKAVNVARKGPKERLNFVRLNRLESSSIEEGKATLDWAAKQLDYLDCGVLTARLMRPASQTTYTYETGDTSDSLEKGQLSPANLLALNFYCPFIYNSWSLTIDSAIEHGFVSLCPEHKEVCFSREHNARLDKAGQPVG